MPVPALETPISPPVNVRKEPTLVVPPLTVPAVVCAATVTENGAMPIFQSAWIQAAEPPPPAAKAP